MPRVPRRSTARLRGQPSWQGGEPASPAAAQGCETATGPARRTSRIPATTTTIKRFDGDGAARRQRDVPVLPHEVAAHAVAGQRARRAQPVVRHLSQRPRARRLPKAQLKTASEAGAVRDVPRMQATKIKRVSHMPLSEGQDGSARRATTRTARRTCGSCGWATGSTRAASPATPRSAARSCSSTRPDARAASAATIRTARRTITRCSSRGRRCCVSAVTSARGIRRRSTTTRPCRQRSNRIIGRGCVNCHHSIHGSNHPSGQSLTR